ncbi:MAG: (5-formylfuran-3-yl)methyl phosphate synthase [Chloroflexota bacterium]
MQLLISVTSVAEARAALRGCAHIIDVKNPGEGALGAAAIAVLRDVCAAMPPHAPVSAALGDSETPTGALALAAYGAAHLGASYVKVGLLTDDAAEAVALLQEVQRSARWANPECNVVAVGYADAERVGALSWRALPAIAAEAQLWGCMIDTAVKDGRGLFSYCDEPELSRWIATCEERGLHSALAGSLTASDTAALRRLQPTVAGFRGAACRGDRVNGQVDEALVSDLYAGLFRP